MNQQTKPKIPPIALILDGIGSVLFAIGIMAIVADFELLPASLRFAFYDWFLVGAGLALMIPMISAMVEQAKLTRQG